MQMPAGVSLMVEISVWIAFEKVGACNKHLLAPVLGFVAHFHKHGNYKVHCFLKHPKVDLRAME